MIALGTVAIDGGADESDWLIFGSHNKINLVFWGGGLIVVEREFGYGILSTIVGGTTGVISRKVMVIERYVEVSTHNSEFIFIDDFKKKLVDALAGSVYVSVEVIEIDVANTEVDGSDHTESFPSVWSRDGKISDSRMVDIEFWYG